MLTKLDVQQRVLKNGKPLSLELFTWDEETRTFSSIEDGLVLDFRGIDYCAFNTGSYCAFNTSSYCTFSTGSYCTFDTGSGCTFDTMSNCTFDTMSNCTFDTMSNCTFKTGSDCTFKTGYECVIFRRDIFQVIQPKENTTIQLCPYSVEGYLEEIDDKFYLNGDKSLGEHIIIDGILSKIIKRKDNVLNVINHGKNEESFIIKQDDIYSHGKTLKEARESLIYKISNRDTSVYKDLTLDSVLSKEEAIKMYRVITGACESGTRYFIESLKEVKEEYSVKEIIEVTKGQFGNESLTKYMNI